MVKISFNKYIPVYHKSRRDYRIKTNPARSATPPTSPKTLNQKPLYRNWKQNGPRRTAPAYFQIYIFEEITSILSMMVTVSIENQLSN